MAPAETIYSFQWRLDKYTDEGERCLNRLSGATMHRQLGIFSSLCSNSKDMKVRTQGYTKMKGVELRLSGGDEVMEMEETQR